MNIILLSGGSGKRLWPLSDEIRSKQFLKLFQDESGKAESMIQRVYRQINMFIPNANIVIATSRKQVGLIREQLGENVKICLEPDRRDTFPAIALATAFLHYELGVSDSESVVICPVDPYVDDSYFSCLYHLHELSQNGMAKIMLLGVQPTYPSEKYGYIIPENADDVSKVAAFKEKPSAEAAKEYLTKNALWNAGIFACNIQYLLNIAREQIRFADYRDLYQRYQELPKISFDYAVVEKEKSICVLRYHGQWKDIGTWNVLAETMTCDTLGNVLLDEQCSNVSVINELDLPILCVGCRNLVVSVSNNGILISDKASSENIKPNIEKICANNKTTSRTWGSFTILDVQAKSLTARLKINKQQRLSYHSHEYRNETWTVVAGSGRAMIDGNVRSLNVGDTILIPAGCRHMMIADDYLSVIEIQTGDLIDVADKTKYDIPGENKE